MVARANSARIQVCPAVWSGSPSGGPHQDIVHLHVVWAAEHGDHRLGNVGGGENVEHVVGGHAAEGCCDPHAKPRSHDTSRIAWANRMARVGEEFPLECPNCGGDIRKILTHLGEPFEPPPLSPARGPPTDWGELVQVHGDRDVFEASPDELPVIDIHSL